MADTPSWMTTTNILLNADVRVMDDGLTRADAIAWRDGRVIAVGARDEVQASAGSDVERWDVGGAAVLPGFIDAHHHPCITALYGGRLRLAPPAVTDMAGLQRALAEAASALPEGEWLIATDWDELLLSERRAPTRKELDDAVPNHPLMAMHYSCHRLAANSRALELAGIDRHTPDPSGGAISRGRNGLPDGVLIERGMSRVESLARASAVAHDPEGLLRRLGEHNHSLARAGITCVVDAAVPRDLADLYREADRRGLLLVPTVMMPVSVTGYLEAPWDALDGPVSGEQQGTLSVGPLKLIFDGAPGCAMCLGWWQTAGVTLSSFALGLRHRTLDPIRTAFSVSPRLGRQIRTGIQIYRRQEAREVVQAATERGFALAIHAIGNAAVDVALEAYEACGSRVADAGIPRIEHATFLDADLIERISGAGVAAVVQPFFLSLPAMACAPNIPGLEQFALRSLLDEKVRVAGSSDFPVAGFEPLDGIRSAVFRRTSFGRIRDAEQRIDLEEAIVTYTRAAAEVSGCADRAGTLEPGKRADLVVLSGPLASDRDLEGARVSCTVIGGELAFGSPPGARDRPTPG